MAQELSCMECWPRICRCEKGPVIRAYTEWAGAGFWFAGTMMRRDDGLHVFIETDGKAYIVDRYMPDPADAVDPVTLYPAMPKSTKVKP